MKGGVSALLLVGPFTGRAVINFNEESQGQRINFSFRYRAGGILTTPNVEKNRTVNLLLLILPLFLFMFLPPLFPPFPLFSLRSSFSPQISQSETFQL